MAANSRLEFKTALIGLFLGGIVPFVVTCKNNDSQTPTELKLETNPSEPVPISKPWSVPTPPAAGERAQERKRMVAEQIANPRDGRTRVESTAVIQAMEAVPRHAFVPAERSMHAYLDTPLPIGYGQTISQPYIVARMTELLDPKKDSKILEIGTGSGYQAAVLAHLTPHVYTVEIIDPLARRTWEVFREQGYESIACRSGDGFFGWEEKAPFDGIIVTCAPEQLPPPLWRQLKPGGRIVIPIGGLYELQKLVVITKTLDGQRESRTVELVRFVPLTRKKVEAEAPVKEPDA